MVLLTQKFNDVYNLFAIRSGQSSTEMTVSDISLYFNDLCYLVLECKNVVNNEMDEIQRLFKWNNFLKSKKAYDKISAEDEKQIGHDINIAYDKIIKLLDK